MALAATPLVLPALGHRTLAASQATPVSGSEWDLLPSYPEFTVIATDSGFEIPATVPAGRVLVTFENHGSVGNGLFFWTLEDGLTAEELAVILPPREPASSGPAPEIFYDANMPGAPGYAEAGESSQAVINFAPGNYAVLTEEGGWPTPFEAVADGGSPVAVDASEPVSSAVIELVDYAFVGFPDDARAGQAVWKVVNDSDEPHQLIIGKVPDGMTLRQVLLGFVPPPDGTPDPDRMTRDQFHAIGGVEIMSPGHEAWALLDLTPGTHAAVCLVTDRMGMRHVEMGMAAVFDILP